MNERYIYERYEHKSGESQVAGSGVADDGPRWMVA